MFIGTRAFDLWATTSSCFREVWSRKFAGVSHRAPRCSIFGLATLR